MQNLLYFRFYGCPKTQLAPVQEHVFKRIFIIFQTPASINNTDHPWVLNHHRLDATHLQHQQLQELISLGLTNLSKQLDLTKVFLNVQADNCVKEVKNNTVLRMLAMWICLGKLTGGELTFLTSGHSHEDIDALFSLLRGWIEAHKEIWSPQAFQQCIQSFYDDSRHRPYEPSRAVVSLTRFRDWRSRLSLANIFLVIYIF